MSEHAARSFVKFSSEREDKLFFRIRHHCKGQDKELEFEKVEDTQGFPVMQCPGCAEQVILGVFNQKTHENMEQQEASQ